MWFRSFTGMHLGNALVSTDGRESNRGHKTICISIIPRNRDHQPSDRLCTLLVGLFRNSAARCRAMFPNRGFGQYPTRSMSTAMQFSHILAVARKNEKRGANEVGVKYFPYFGQKRESSNVGVVVTAHTERRKLNSDGVFKFADTRSKQSSPHSNSPLKDTHNK